MSHDRLPLQAKMATFGGATGVVTGTTVSPGTTNLVQIDHGGEAMVRRPAAPCSARLLRVVIVRAPRPLTWLLAPRRRHLRAQTRQFLTSLLFCRSTGLCLPSSA